MNDKQRKEFEDWCRRHQHVDAQGDRVLDVETGREFYMDPSIDFGWEAWLAARRSQDEQVRDVIEGVNDLCKDVVNAEKAQCGEHYNGWLGDAYDKAVTLQSLAQLKETTDE